MQRGCFRLARNARAQDLFALAIAIDRPHEMGTGRSAYRLRRIGKFRFLCQAVPAQVKQAKDFRLEVPTPR
jgi:hypothetical protein